MAGLAGAPALTPSADGRLEVFATAVDNALWHPWQTAPSGGWSGWFSHGAGAGGPFTVPAIAANADGRLALFVVAFDANLWTIEQVAPSDGWSGWTRRAHP